MHTITRTRIRNMDHTTGATYENTVFRRRLNCITSTNIGVMVRRTARVDLWLGKGFKNCSPRIESQGGMLEGDLPTVWKSVIYLLRYSWTGNWMKQKKSLLLLLHSTQFLLSSQEEHFNTLKRKNKPACQNRNRCSHGLLFNLMHIRNG